MDVPRQGRFALQADEVARIADFGFVSGRSTHADRLATIRHAWQQHGQLIDPHTADGLKVGLQHADPKVPMIVLETALPAKFAATIREAVGIGSAAAGRAGRPGVAAAPVPEHAQ